VTYQWNKRPTSVEQAIALFEHRVEHVAEYKREEEKESEPAGNPYSTRETLLKSGVLSFFIKAISVAAASRWRRTAVPQKAVPNADADDATPKDEL